MLQTLEPKHTAEINVISECRRAQRTQMSWPVSIWLPDANRFFNGSTVNIAKGGVLLNVPMTTPIKDGSVVEINFPRTMSLAKKKGQFARIKSGKVVRVNRESLISNASVEVAVQFS